MENLTLYQLTSEYQAIEDALIENGGELTPELEDLMNANTEALALKVDGYNKILRRMEGSEAALDAEIKRLTALKKTAANAQKSLKKHLKDAMEYAGLDKIEGTLCKAFLRHTTSTEVDNETFLQPYHASILELQERCPMLTIKVEPNKTAIKDAFFGKDYAPQGVSFKDNTSITIK